MKELLKKYGRCGIRRKDVHSVTAGDQQAISVVRRALSDHHQKPVEVLQFDVVITPPKLDETKPLGTLYYGETIRDVYAEVMYRPICYYSQIELTGRGFGFPRAVVRLGLKAKNGDSLHWMVTSRTMHLNFEGQEETLVWGSSALDRHDTLLILSGVK